MSWLTTRRMIRKFGELKIEQFVKRCSCCIRGAKDSEQAHKILADPKIGRFFEVMLLSLAVFVWLKACLPIQA